MTGWSYMTRRPLRFASLIVRDELGDVIGENDRLVVHDQMTAVISQLLIVRDELGDVIGQNDGLVVHDEMTAVGNARTLPHVGEQQLVEEWPVTNHKVS
jgi:hypothetical protein